MKRLLAGLLLILVTTLGTVFDAEAAVRVKGYYRKDGTYVQSHYRSNPDGNPYNNWSYPGNTNPYTGEIAPGNPDTYLRNYYDNSSGYSTNPSLNTDRSNLLYSGSSGAAAAALIQKPEKTITSTAKNWADNNPARECLNAPELVGADQLDCDYYRKYKDLYQWKSTDPYNTYPSCGGSAYYLNACPAETTFVCNSGRAFCQTVTVRPSSKSGLTEAQVQAIISLLQSFGADQVTITNVERALR